MANTCRSLSGIGSIRQDAVFFELFDRQLLVAAEGHGAGHNKPIRAEVGPLEAERLLPPQAAVQAQRHKRAGARLGHGLHERVALGGGQVLFASGLGVRRDLDLVAGVAQQQAVVDGRGEDLPHGQQDLILQALGHPGHLRHDTADVHRPHVAQLHAAQHLADVVVVRVAVHLHRGVAQVGLVGLQPDFCPLADGRAVAVFDARLHAVTLAQQRKRGVPLGRDGDIALQVFFGRDRLPAGNAADKGDGCHLGERLKAGRDDVGLWLAEQIINGGSEKSG